MGESSLNKRRVSYVDNKPKTSKPDPDAWIQIGTLKHVIIYPIDGGAGCPQDHTASVYFSRYGLSNMLDTRCDYQDKGLIVFSAKNMQAKVRLYNTLKNLNSQALYLKIAEKLLKQPCELKTVHIHYLNDPETELLEVKDLGDDIAGKIAEMLGGTDVDLRLGVCTAETRYKFNNNIKNKMVEPNLFPDNEMNRFSYHFSSYTLVNTTHIKALQTKCKKEISYKNFRPNLVVEGTPGVNYDENIVEAVKISDDIHEVVFSTVRVWSHNNSINDNSSETPEELLVEPYNTLLQDCSKNSKYDNQGSDLPDVPVFGLNLEMHDTFQDKIAMLPGAKVFAKFKVREKSKSLQVHEDTYL